FCMERDEGDSSFHMTFTTEYAHVHLETYDNGHSKQPMHICGLNGDLDALIHFLTKAEDGDEYTLEREVDHCNVPFRFEDGVQHAAFEQTGSGHSGYDFCVKQKDAADLRTLAGAQSETSQEAEDKKVAVTLTYATWKRIIADL